MVRWIATALAISSRCVRRSTISSARRRNECVKSTSSGSGAFRSLSKRRYPLGHGPQASESPEGANRSTTKITIHARATNQRKPMTNLASRGEWENEIMKRDLIWIAGVAVAFPLALSVPWTGQAHG